MRLATCGGVLVPRLLDLRLFVRAEMAVSRQPSPESGRSLGDATTLLSSSGRWLLSGKNQYDRIIQNTISIISRKRITNYNEHEKNTKQT